MDFSYISKVGDREVNEDYVLVFSLNDKTIFVLADGLGGHGCGEIASREAAECVKQTFIENDSPNIEVTLKKAFDNANQQLKKMQKEMNDYSLFKTTLVVLIISEECTLWGHIGDSRIYHFEKNILIERSMDHSVPQMLVMRGKLKDRKIRYHEDRNRLLKVLGADYSNSKANINGIEPRNSDAAFLLCSDGFWEHINENNIQKTLLKTKTADEWLSKMENLVLNKGSKIKMDNYSAIAVRL